MQIIHHGAVNGVTGSCHQLDVNNYSHTLSNNISSYLIDCGLFQGAETAGQSSAEQLQISFDINNIKALIVTHCHIDHVGRIPYLLAAGFNQPIYATTATAALLPLVIEDALKVGVTRDQKLIQACINRLNKLLVAVDYGQWITLPINLSTATASFAAKTQPSVASSTQLSSASPTSTVTPLSTVSATTSITTKLLATTSPSTTLIKAHVAASETETPPATFTKAKLKFKPAGHILGSAYVEIDLTGPKSSHRVVFSGDLGASYAPLLASPKSP